jgi:diaminopimelate epimerase
MTTVSLTKHHGLGNDFLVWIGGDVDGAPELARRWCDRRRGIGADGLLIDDGASGRMVLFNADGSRAEMSGNGIRCFVQAVGGGRPGFYEIETDVGRRIVEVTESNDPRTVTASVDMGVVAECDAPVGWADIGADPLRPVAHVSLGNPHTVVGVDDVWEVPLEELGARLTSVNLEVIAPGPERHAITMRVHERGAGVTEACGTGACASGWAAVKWGLATPLNGEILVHMDGGDATVKLDIADQGRVTLVGPATYIATITLEV